MLPHRFMRPALLVLVALILSSCATEPSTPPVKVILGGTLIDGSPRAPMPNSVILVADGKVTAVGRLGSVEIPENAIKTNAGGLYVTPGRGGLVLAPGADADLFLVNGNPLDNPYLLGSPMRTMKAGEWTDAPKD